MKINTRVELPAWADRWMMGDRYGVIVRFSMVRRGAMAGDSIEAAHVKLDKSGKIVRLAVDALQEV